MPESEQGLAESFLLLSNDYFNAVYDKGRLAHQGSPDMLNEETVRMMRPDVVIRTVPQDLYDEFLDGQGYPDRLSALPLDRLV